MWTAAPTRSSLARGVALAATAVLTLSVAALGAEAVAPGVDTVAAPIADRPALAAEPADAEGADAPLRGATVTTTTAALALAPDTEDVVELVSEPVPTPEPTATPTAEPATATAEPTATATAEPTATATAEPTASPANEEPTASEEPAATPSDDSTASGSDSSCDLQCRGERILAMAPLTAPSSYTVEFRPGRDGYLGMTYSSSREIVIWVRDDLSDRQMAATLLHEIGHAYDFVGLGGRGDDARRRWADTRGFDWDGRDAWFGNGCSGCTDYSIGAGDLAESVHACWAPGWDTFRSQMAGPPTDAQCDLLARVLR